METDIRQIENLFRRSDFSKESGLKRKLSRDLFPVREVTLKELMEKEGMKSSASSKEDILKKRNMKRQAERRKERQTAKEKEPDSLGAVERENPMIKKNRPPTM